MKSIEHYICRLQYAFTGTWNESDFDITYVVLLL